MTGRKPGVVLIMENPADVKHLEKLKLIAQKNDIRIWTMTQ